MILIDSVRDVYKMAWKFNAQLSFASYLGWEDGEKCFIIAWGHIGHKNYTSITDFTV